MKKVGFFILATLVVGRAFIAQAEQRPSVTVGSKTFTESYILSEIISQVIENVGEANVNRKFGLGGTGIVFEAIQNGGIDVYPEYTGTLAQDIIKDPSLKSTDAIQAALAPMGLVMSGPLGFNNTYALAARGEFARSHHLQRISDLAKTPGIRIGFSHEFMKRADGFPGLEARYGLGFFDINTMEHSLSYEALDRGEIDLTDIYSTDAEIEKQGLVVLEDDKNFFPGYLAVLVARKEFTMKFPKTWAALRSLEGKINKKEMIHLNAMADIVKVGFSKIAQDFLSVKPRAGRFMKGQGRIQALWILTRQHLFLVMVSLALSILFGLPLGVISSRSAFLGQVILASSGLLQTIPSLALLCFLIPLFGIGTLPALVALFLYG